MLNVPKKMNDALHVSLLDGCDLLLGKLGGISCTTLSKSSIFFAQSVIKDRDILSDSSSLALFFLFRYGTPNL